MVFVIKNVHAVSNVVCCAFPLLLLAFPSTAHAEADTQSWNLQYRLTANAPSNCPDEEVIHEILEARLERPHSFRQDAARVISVDVVPRANNVEARIQARDENGTITTDQKLTTPSWRCDLMAERIVFVLRDIIEPLELPIIEKTQKSGPKVAPQDDPSPAPNAPLAAQPPRQDSTPTVKNVVTPDPQKLNARNTTTSDLPKLALSLSIGPAWWNAPETALSTALGVEAQWKRVALGIEGHYDYAWAVPSLGEYRAERVGAALWVCACRHLSKQYYLRGCGLGTFTQISVNWPQHDSSQHQAAMIDLGARFGLGAWLFSSFGVELRADAAFVLARPHVYLQRDQVWRVAPFTGALRIAFVGAFDVF